MESQNISKARTGKVVSVKAGRAIPFQRTTTKVHSTPSKSHTKARSVTLGRGKD